MRIHVQLLGECLAVNCISKESVQDLVENAVRKLMKLRPALFLAKEIEKLPERKSSETPEEQNNFLESWTDENDFRFVREIRKTTGGAMLDPDDLVLDVLRDEEFVLIVVITEDLMEWLLHYQPRMPIVCIHIIAQFQLVRDAARTKLYVKSGIERKKPTRHFQQNEFDIQFHVYGNPEEFVLPSETLILDGQSLTPENLLKCGRGLYRIELSSCAEERINKARKLLEDIVQKNEAFCVSWVPEKGTVGCSGDLAPLAHLALGLMGEGQMWSPKTGWDDAFNVLMANGLKPVELGPKEGIALINGTQLVTGIGAEVVERADMISKEADVIAALSLDVLKGTTKAFDPEIHKLRPHKGQMETARRLRALLHSEINPSQIAESHRFCGRVQDAYTLRCVPQVHGIVQDTIDFVKKTLTIEMNSATDNPLIFADRGEIISGGNFHGEYPAKVLDYLAIAVHELAQMSERRIERLVNSTLSNLPPFLTENGGLNSGFMMVQVVAASLVSENKVLCHPSSVDSIPTSMNQEDHVSMGGFAARKALKVVEHVEQVLAMELLAACQGMDFLRPLTTTAPLQEVYKLVRSVSPFIERDRFLTPELNTVTKLLQSGKVWECVKPHLDSAVHKEAENPAYFDTPIHSPTSFHQQGECALNEDIEEPPIKKQKS